MKIAAAYIPVVHKGHREFCRKVKPDILYVLGRSFLSEAKLLERDIRALEPEETVTACKALSLASDVRVLEKKDVATLKKADAIVFADDEVMHQIADSYLSDTSVVFEKVFLRWDKMAAVTASPVVSDFEISEDSFDREVMSNARGQAQKSSDWWRQVGAVVIKEGRFVLDAFNQHKPGEHAPYIDGDPRSNFSAGEHLDVSTALHSEAGLIARAAREGISLRGASMYVTTFPCPNCAMQIVQAGIQKLYYADGYSNLNAQYNLRSAGVKIVRVKEI